MPWAGKHRHAWLLMRAMAAREEAVRALDKLDGQHLTPAFWKGRYWIKRQCRKAIEKYTEIINAINTPWLNMR